MAARRANGEGSIGKRKDGRWEARITVTLDDGQQQRRAFYGQTRGEVADKLREAQNKHASGTPLPREDLTLSAHLATWLETKKVKLRPESWRRYDDLVKHIVAVKAEKSRLPLGKRKLARIGIADVKELHAELERAGLSGTTCQHAHGVLHAALQDALRWDLVSRNVASLVPAPRRSTGEMKFLGPDAARALIVAAKDQPLGTFFIVALTAGLREGELQALRWKDVDLERRRLRVVATLTTVRAGVPIFGEPKTQHSRRTAWLSEMAVEALERHKYDQAARKRLAAGAWAEYDLVFTNELGAPLWRSQVRKSWLALLEKAELPPMRIHDLRHTAATLLLAEGVPVKVVSEALGHSDVKTTLSIYAHVIEGAQEQAANAMDRLLGS